MTGSTAVLVEDSEPDALAFRRASRALYPELDLRHFWTADEALAALEGLPRNSLLFVVDLNLPGMSGLEFIRRLRASQRYRHYPALIMTSASDGRSVMASYSAGAFGHVVKPTSTPEMHSVVRACVSYWFEAVKQARPEA